MNKFIQTISTVAIMMMIAGQPLWAASTKADLEKLQAEVQDLKESQTAIQAKGDLTAGGRMGITGTPAFVLGLTDPKDPNKDNVTQFISGAQSLEKFSQTIEDLLKQAEEGEEGP